MHKQRFFKGLSWLLVLNFLIKPVWILLIDREVQNRIGIQTYGSYFALLNLSYVLLFIADAGLSNMLVKQVAANPDKVSTRQLLQVKAGMLAIYALVCCMVGWMSGIQQWSIFFYVILIQALSSLLLFLRSLLAAHQFFQTDAFFSVADKALVIFLFGIFLTGWWLSFSLELFLQVQLFATVTVSFVLFILLVQRRLLQKGQPEKLQSIIRRILPFAAIILLMGTHYRLDGFLLERLRPDGATQAGIYAMAYRLLDAANMVGYLTASFLVPFLARNKGHQELVKIVVNVSERSLFFLGIVISAFAFVFAPWIQQTLYHTTNPFISNVIQYCLAVLPAYFLTHVYGSVLTASDGLRQFISILIIAVLLNLLLNFIFIPIYGALGSCYAALASQYTCALACYFFARRHLSLPMHLKPWMLYILSAGVFFLLLTGLKSLIHSVWIILAAVAALIVLLAFLQRRNIEVFIRSITQ